MRQAEGSLIIVRSAPEGVLPGASPVSRATGGGKGAERRYGVAGIALSAHAQHRRFD